MLVSKTVADVRRPLQTTGRQVLELIFNHQETKRFPTRRNATDTRALPSLFRVSLPEVIA